MPGSPRGPGSTRYPERLAPGFDFGAAYGVWIRRNDASWELLHGLSPEQLVATRLDRD